MQEQKRNQCLVLLPAGDSHHARLFDELFFIAIAKSGLAPCNIRQELPNPLPIDQLIQEIVASDAVFADLSRNDADIWLALGYALALNKPLCLVSSNPDLNTPLDVQALDILRYFPTPFPSDYLVLEQNITKKLSALLPKPANDGEPQTNRTLFIQPAPLPIADDLTAHEILALTIIGTNASQYGISPRSLGLEMQAGGAAHLTSHAMSSLKRRSFIERHSVQVRDRDESFISDNLFITAAGESWLTRHRKRTSSLRSLPPRELFLSSR